MDRKYEAERRQRKRTSEEAGYNVSAYMICKLYSPEMANRVIRGLTWTVNRICFD